MPESATLEAPAAPAQSTPPPEIHVTAPAATDPGPPQPPPRKGSAKESLFKSLRQKAGVEEPQTTTNAPQTTTETPQTTTDTEQTTTETPQTTTETPPTSAAEEKGKKVSPWKLVDQYKSKVVELERQVAEARTSSLAVKEKEELSSKLAEAQKRLDEFEEERRFTNYQKDPEFQQKYEKPYVDAWKRAMAELGELTVEDQTTGQERPVSTQDILELVNLPLGKARELANKLYGEFADDVMGHRKEIKGLFDAQQAALDEAKKNGAEWEKQRTERMTQAQKQTASQIKELWAKFNDSAVKDERYGQYFKPVEGDEDGNTRLKKGYEMADRAFTVNPLDPSLTPEQRAEIVKLHAAVRNRAAGFGRLLYQHQKAQTRIAELEKQLGQFKGSVPGAGDAAREKTETPRSARDEVFGALHKIAH